MKNKYYLKNIDKWKKGGKYYYYKPKVYVGEVTIKKGLFIVSFD